MMKYLCSSSDVENVNNSYNNNGQQTFSRVFTWYLLAPVDRHLACPT
jgi:hypothetical protein